MPASRRVEVLGSFMLSLNSCIAACAMVARAPWGSGGSGVHVLRLLHEAEMEAEIQTLRNARHFCILEPFTVSRILEMASLLN